MRDPTLDDDSLRQRAQALLTALRASALSESRCPWDAEQALADAEGWTMGHARQVVDAYLHFLVMTRLAGHPVCPPAEVDTVWHWHLTQTRAYAALCERHLGGFLHHEPSRGGPAEDKRHRQMYQQTLDSYPRLFGTAAPADLWPSAGQRFAGTAMPSPTDAARVGAWPQAWCSPWRARAVLIGGAAALAALVVGWRAGATGSDALAGAVATLDRCVLAISVLLALIAQAMAWAWVRPQSHLAIWLGRQVPDSVAPAALDAYEAAWLAGGDARVTTTLMVEGVARGWLRLETTRNGRREIRAARLCAGDLAAARRAPIDHPVRRVLQEALSETPALTAASLHRRLAPSCQRIHAQLQKAGLALAEGCRPRLLVLAATWWTLVCFYAGWRIWDSALPSTTIWMWISVALAWWGIGLVAGPWRATPLGMHAVRHRRETVRTTRPSWPPAEGDAAAQAEGLAVLPMAFALLGTVVLAGDPSFAGVHHVVGFDAGVFTGRSDPSRTHGGGGGCGAGAIDGGCGGDGGGGGCGGGG